VIPETVASLYAFLGLVAPGLVYQWLRERARPALKESAFREAGRVALTSLIFTSFSLVAWTLLAPYRPGLLANPADWLRGGNQYVVGNSRLVAQTTAFVVAVSCLAAGLAHSAGERLAGSFGRQVVKASVWYQLLVADVPKGKAPWVGLKLSDDSFAWGYVDYFTVDQEMKDREISLRGPGLKTEAAGKDTREEKKWERLVYRAEDVVWMKVMYLDAKPREGWWRRVKRRLSREESAEGSATEPTETAADG
jgi:hypothetical protein